MNINYNNFIGIYTDVYPHGYCSHTINEFERLIKTGVGSNRQQSEDITKHKKDDMQLELSLYPTLDFQNTNITNMFFQGLQYCYDSYTEKFSILKEDKIHATVIKMQRTDPGGGYHIWHGERGSGIHSNRVLVYMLYLNTLEKEEAGETEFLYQQLRIQPKENTMIIWPAAYTHTHRGNVVHGEKSKYIITGWFNYA